MDPITMGHHSGDNHGRGSLATSSSSFDVWNNFFLLAGIPNNVAHGYAVTFSQHRIRIDMLKEITKDILLDMNIKAMGDIIAILRHAKNLCAQDELRVGAKAAMNSTSTAAPTIPSHNAATSPRLGKIARDEPHLSQRIPITSSSHQRASAGSSNITTTTTTTTNTGNKIQSRLNLSSGALLASSAQSIDLSDRNNNNDHNHSRNYSSTSNGHYKSKTRPSSSSVSSSLAKRLGPAQDDRRILKRNLPEKTLTVHYPSKSAIARARERISAGSTISHDIRASSSSGSSSSKPVSIKSRLGATVVRSQRR